MLKIAVLGSTKGTDLQAIIDAIHSKRLAVSINVVISNKKDAYILERAKKYRIPAFFADPAGKSREEYDKELLALLKKYAPDLILCIGYFKIITPLLINPYRNRIINVHPSLLPKYGGKINRDIYAEVLKNRDKETGCTIHFVTEEVDSGEIIMQKKVKIDPKDTVETLKAKVQEQEGKAFIEVLKLFEKGKIQVKDDKAIIG